MLAALVGSLTFGSSLARLVDQPFRYGSAYDLLVGGNGADELPAAVRTTVEQDPAVGGLVLYTESQARHGGRTLRLVGMDRIKGDSAPPVLEGRLPEAADEIALGRLAAHALHVGIGDPLALEGDSGTVTLRVTGLVVIPTIGLNEGVGQDGLVTMATLADLDATARPTDAAVTFAPGASAGTARRLALATGIISSPDEPQPSSTRPAAITNVARVRPIPYVLAALLGTLCLLTLCQAMVLSVQNRRRDAAILQSLGADRQLMARAVHWQATAFVTLPVVIGVPLGVVAGRAVFRLFADSIGTLNDASVPLLMIAIAAVLAAVVGNVVAVIASRGMLGGSPSVSLRTE
jgi:ABC-type antimicrobial peptide transport system permease subunit